VLNEVWNDDQEHAFVDDLATNGKYTHFMHKVQDKPPGFHNPFAEDSERACRRRHAHPERIRANIIRQLRLTVMALAAGALGAGVPALPTKFKRGDQGADALQDQRHGHAEYQGDQIASVTVHRVLSWGRVWSTSCSRIAPYRSTDVDMTRSAARRSPSPPRA
jgi:hypothetical protein